MNVRYHPNPVKIPCAPGKERRQVVLPPEKPAVLTPASAWRVLNKLTRGSVSRATFYRWLSSGKVFSYRVGYHLYVPMPEIENIAKQCHEGKWS